MKRDIAALATRVDEALDALEEVRRLLDTGVSSVSVTIYDVGCFRRQRIESLAVQWFRDHQQEILESIRDRALAEVKGARAALVAALEEVPS